MLQNDDVNVAYINFIETFSKLYNLHCPVKKAHAKGIYKKPWITNGLKNAFRKKNYLYRSFLREPKLQNTGIKLRKNKLTSILRLAEKAYLLLNLRSPRDYVGRSSVRSSVRRACGVLDRQLLNG